jgi:general secretion pathway protein J
LILEQAWGHLNIQQLNLPTERIKEAGFTLIEILLVLGILATISVAAITIVAGQVETRGRLQTINEAQHSLNVAMSKIYEDFRHMYVTSKFDKGVANESARVVKPGLIGRDVSAFFTTRSHTSVRADSPESNLAVVRYVARQDAKRADRQELVRYVDLDFLEPVEKENVGVEQHLISDLKEFKVTYWDGSNFRPDWTTLSGETAGKLPKMVHIALSIYVPKGNNADSASESASETSRENAQTIALETTVYVMSTATVPDLHPNAKEYRFQ